MSEAPPAWFKSHRVPASSQDIHKPCAPLPHNPGPGHSNKSPTPSSGQWFSSVAPGPTYQAGSTLVCQPNSAWHWPQQAHKALAAPHPLCGAKPSALATPSQAVSDAPGILLPVSQVMSHAPIPGPALRPCSPWRHIPSQQACSVPSSSGASVVVATDRRQPTLAEALGFADSPQQPPCPMSGGEAAAVQSSNTAPAQLTHRFADSNNTEIVAQVSVPQSQSQPTEERDRSLRQASQANVGALMRPGLQRFVGQVEAATVDQPAKFDAFLQLLHENQAGNIDRVHFEEQVCFL